MSKRRRRRQLSNLGPDGLPQPLTWRPRVRIFGLISGAIGGLGAVVLIQQYGIAPLGRALTLQGLIGGALSGIIVPSIVYAFVVRKFNRKLAVARGRRSGGPAAAPGMAVVLLFVTLLSAFTLFGTVAAQAEASGPCRLVIDGIDVATIDVTPSDAIPVESETSFIASLSWPSDFASFEVRFFYAGFSYGFGDSEVDEDASDGGPDSGTVELPVDTFFQYAGGLYEVQVNGVLVDGQSCNFGMLFDVDRNPLETIVGKTAAATAAVGAIGVLGVGAGALVEGTRLVGDLTAMLGDLDVGQVFDATGIDANADGVADAIAMDTTGDGLIDQVAVDMDADGTFDRVMDVDYAGPPEAAPVGELMPDLPGDTFEPGAESVGDLMPDLPGDTFEPAGESVGELMPDLPGDTFEPAVGTPEPVGTSVEPGVDGPEPTVISDTFEPVGEVPVEPAVDTPEPVGTSVEPGVDGPEPTVISDTFEPVGEVPVEPAVDTPEPTVISDTFEPATEPTDIPVEPAAGDGPSGDVVTEPVDPAPATPPSPVGVGGTAAAAPGLGGEPGGLVPPDTVIEIDPTPAASPVPDTPQMGAQGAVAPGVGSEAPATAAEPPPPKMPSPPKTEPSVPATPKGAAMPPSPPSGVDSPLPTPPLDAGTPPPAPPSDVGTPPPAPPSGIGSPPPAPPSGVGTPPPAPPGVDGGGGLPGGQMGVVAAALLTPAALGTLKRAAESRSSGTAPTGGEFWFYVARPTPMFGLEDYNVLVGELSPGVWYLGKGRQGEWVQTADTGTQTEGWVSGEAVQPAE